VARDTLVPPFGASVAGAAALVPAAVLFDGAAPVGQTGVTVAAVESWVGALSSRVAVNLDGWERLSTVAPAPGVPSDRDQLVAAARDLVHNGAASYLEAARHPAASGKSATSYDAVLWARFTEGLTSLGAWLSKRLEVPDAGDTPAAELDTDGGAEGSFPPASFTPETLRF
jgi:hypothetical protein